MFELFIIGAVFASFWATMLLVLWCIGRAIEQVETPYETLADDFDIDG